MSISFIYPFALWLLLLIPLTVGLALFGPRRPTRARFWSGLALRAFLLGLIVLAVAGIQLRLRADTLTAVFVLDVSDSLPAEEQARGETIIRRAIESMPPGDRAAVVVFGEEALVERLATQQGTLPGITSVPVTSRTDLASALQLALALFPDEGAKRLVLLSDGRENLGYALDQAELAAAHQIELVFIPLHGPEGQAEVLVESLQAPSDLRQGQAFDLTAVIHSSAQLGAILRVHENGQTIYSQEIQLEEGTNRFLIPVETSEPGFRRFILQIVPEADTRLQNNTASAFTFVHGPPSVLLVEGTPGEGENIAHALRDEEMVVTVITPEELPSEIAQLAVYESIILANVPAAALPPGAMQALPTYVRDLGRGLVMTGGESAYGAGGYLRTPLEDTLPVFMDVRAREESANLALVLAVDKSGSMGRCHCDDPDLNQSYTRAESGQPKVDIAKAAVMRAAGALGQRDYLGVVAFDDHASWAYEISPWGDYVTLENSIGAIQATGQTNLRAGVEAAYEALETTDARRKHIILLTDGWSYSGDITAIVKEMDEKGVTLSVVAAGGGSAEYLEKLALDGGGRYYPATDILRVPDFFLKETIKAVGEYIIEEPFYPLPSLPGPILRGLDVETLPPLLGYNGTSPKNTARIDLATPRGDPLLASWQHGLGRAAAWTSDLKGQWGMAWVTWEDFAQFASQLIGWTLPTPQLEGLTAQVNLEDDQAVVRVEALDQEGFPHNFLDIQATLIGPELGTEQVSLPQIGPGRYESRVKVSQTGTYLVRVGVFEDEQALGQSTLGLVVPYSPEYKTSGTDLGLLLELARRTGGGELSEPEQVFLHNLPSADFAREIWRPLLMLAALLFPLDVALRRIMFGKQDILKAWLWIRARMPLFADRRRDEPRVLGQLFQARDRVRQRRARPERSSLPDVQISSETSEKPDQPTSPPVTSSEDTLARLREAKKRARQDES